MPYTFLPFDRRIPESNSRECFKMLFSRGSWEQTRRAMATMELLRAKGGNFEAKSYVSIIL